MAQWAAMGKLHPDEPFIHESVIGSLFTGRIEQLTQVGEVPAIIPPLKDGPSSPGSIPSISTRRRIRSRMGLRWGKETIEMVSDEV